MTSPFAKQCWITRETIDAATVEKLLDHPAGGALVVFVGRVRNYNEEKQVAAIFYEAYESMAVKTFLQIADTAHEKFGVLGVAIVHRVGLLKVGEASVGIGVLAAHRQEAFNAASYCLEELKIKSPIWKKEEFVDGNNRWQYERQLS